MTTDLGRFNPATWHELGVLRAPDLPIKRPKARTRGRNIVIAAASVALSLSAPLAASPSIFSLEFDSTSASAFLGQPVPDTSDASADRIDPHQWGKLITLFERLPYHERKDPDDLEPLI
jgi:hypothetical protein